MAQGSHTAASSSENGAPAYSRAGLVVKPAREYAGAPPDFHPFRASQRDMKAPLSIGH